MDKFDRSGGREPDENGYDSYHDFSWKKLFVLLGVLWLGWFIFIHEPSPQIDMQVDIDLTVDNQPIHLSRVVGCERRVTKRPFGDNYSTLYIKEGNGVIGKRVGKGAVIVWVPNECQGGRLKPMERRDPKDGPLEDNRFIRSDGRLAHIGWTPIPEGNMPVIGWVDDADKMDEILLYATPMAYKNKNARVQFKKIVLKNPELGKPIDKPDEFTWLSPINNYGDKKWGSDWDKYGIKGFIINPIYGRIPERTKMFWSKIDKNKKEVQYIPPAQLKDKDGKPYEMNYGADIGTEFGDFGLYFQRGLWSDMYATEAPSLDTVKTLYPLRWDGKAFHVKFDMEGFIYLYDNQIFRGKGVFGPRDTVITNKDGTKTFIPDYMSPEEDASKPSIIFPDGTIVPRPFSKTNLFYVPSYNNLYHISGAGTVTHKTPNTRE